MNEFDEKDKKPLMENEELKFFTKPWFTVVMIILLWPIGLVMMWHYKHFTKTIRILVTVMIAAILCFYLYSHYTAAQKNSVTPNQQTEESDTTERNTLILKKVAEAASEYKKEASLSDHMEDWTFVEQTQEDKNYVVVLGKGSLEGKDSSQNVQALVSLSEEGTPKTIHFLSINNVELINDGTLIESNLI